jgi:predicted molibdopterin-dependent oxidoreductase YjgC
VSPLTQKVTPPGTARADWIIAADLAAQLGKSLRVESVEQIWDELTRLSPAHAGLERADVADGVVVGANPGAYSPPAPRSSGNGAADDAGGWLLVATRKMYDQGVGVQHSPSSADLAQPSDVRVHPAELAALGVADGATVRVTSARGTLEATVTADAGVPQGSAAMIFNQVNSVAALIDAASRVTTVRIERS